VTLDARGNYGTAYVGLNYTSITRPAVSMYTAMVGPSYRFYVQPKFSVAGRVLAGYAHNNDTGDTNGFGTIIPPGQTVGLLYPNTSSYAASASVVGDWNVLPQVSVRLSAGVLLHRSGRAPAGGSGIHGRVRVPLRPAVGRGARRHAGLRYRMLLKPEAGCVGYERGRLR